MITNQSSICKLSMESMTEEIFVASFCTLPTSHYVTLGQRNATSGLASWLKHFSISNDLLSGVSLIVCKTLVSNCRNGGLDLLQVESCVALLAV